MNSQNTQNITSYFDYLEEELNTLKIKLNTLMQIIQPNQTRADLPEILSVKLIAQLLDTTPNNIYQKILHHGLPFIKELGGVRKETFFKWLDEKESLSHELAKQRKKTKEMLS